MNPSKQPFPIYPSSSFTWALPESTSNAQVGAHLSATESEGSDPTASAMRQSHTRDSSTPQNSQIAQATESELG